jgi:hypothetical protein
MLKKSAISAKGPQTRSVRQFFEESLMPSTLTKYSNSRHIKSLII